MHLLRGKVTGKTLFPMNPVTLPQRRKSRGGGGSFCCCQLRKWRQQGRNNNSNSSSDIVATMITTSVEHTHSSRGNNADSELKSVVHIVFKRWERGRERGKRGTAPVRTCMCSTCTPLSPNVEEANLYAYFMGKGGRV